MAINFSIPIRGTDFSIEVKKIIFENGSSSFSVKIPGFCDELAGKSFSYDPLLKKLVCDYSTHPELEAAVIMTLTDYCRRNEITLH